MSVNTNSTCFTVNGSFTMAWKDLPDAINAYLKHVPSTGSVEANAYGWAAKGLPPGSCIAVVSEICHWGGKWGPSVLSRVLLNSTGTISSKLKHAYAQKKPADAIAASRSIYGLGISFGSKHLRMLDPERFVVLDSILSSKLGYRLTDSSYRDICNDLAHISHLMTKMGITNPLHAHYTKQGLSNPRLNPNVWWPADIELVCFAEAHPQNWSTKGDWESPKGKGGMTAGVRSCPTQNNFDDFWDWLQTPQTVPTLRGKSKLTGAAAKTYLELVTSGGTKVRVKRVTVASYCSQILWSQFTDLSGNMRYVAALLSEYLSL